MDSFRGGEGGIEPVSYRPLNLSPPPKASGASITPLPDNDFNTKPSIRLSINISPGEVEIINISRNRFRRNKIYAVPTSKCRTEPQRGGGILGLRTSPLPSPPPVGANLKSRGCQEGRLRCILLLLLGYAKNSLTPCSTLHLLLIDSPAAIAFHFL